VTFIVTHITPISQFEISVIHVTNCNSRVNVCKFVTCITLISNCKIGVICVTINSHIFYIVMDETTKFASHKCPELWPTTIRKNQFLL
jgi:hypothetical protein